MNDLPDVAADALVETWVEEAGEEATEDDVVATDDDSVVLLGDGVAAELAVELAADELESDDPPPPQPASVRAARHRTAVPRGTVAIFTD